MFVGLPDERERLEILEALSSTSAERETLSHVAAACPGYCGSDLRNLIQTAHLMQRMKLDANVDTVSAVMCCSSSSL